MAALDLFPFSLNKRWFSVWFLEILAVVIIILLAIIVLKYRLPANKPKLEYEGEVIYRMIEWDYGLRVSFESLLRNKKIHIEASPGLFVSIHNWRKLWPESPIDMMEKQYTIKAKLIAKPLFFGGMSLANVLSVEKITKYPTVIK